MGLLTSVRKVLPTVFAVASLFALEFASAQTALTASAPEIPPGKRLIVTYRALVPGNISRTVGEVRSTTSVSGSNFTPPSPVETFIVLDFASFIRNPVHFLWNGALAMQNVVSIMNTGSTPLGVDARLLNQNGGQLGTLGFQVPAQGEFDLPVSSMSGFAPGGLGTLRLEFSSEEFAGNGFYYRFAADQRTLEFMVGSAFDSSLAGPSFVTFNTIQPSRRVTDLQNEVANWLSIGNMDPGAAKSFTANFYSQTGQFIRSASVSIPPDGRRDLSAGHENPGPGRVGLIEIVPADLSAPYTAQVTRYGASAPVSALAKFFHFAVLSPARVPATGVEFVPISRGGRGENWLVLSNASPSDGVFNVKFRNNAGGLVSEMDIPLAARAQIHLFANSALAPGETGVAEITTATAAGFTADSTFYFYDPDTGETTAAYSTPSRPAGAGPQIGGYNTFLGMQNYFKVFNTSGTADIYTAMLHTALGAPLGAISIGLGPRSGNELAVNLLPFRPALDTVGPITIENNDSSYISEFLRVQVSPNGRRIEAIQSIPGRPVLGEEQ